MNIYLVELKNKKMGLFNQKVNGIMLPILAVWAERIGWHAEVDFTELENVDYEKEWDVVAICTFTHLAPSSYFLAERFRKMGKIVVIGGPHTKGRAEEARDHADVVFNNCNEQAWHKFLRAVEAKEITPSHDRGIFFPAPELSEVPPYLEYKKFCSEDKLPMLISSLGCPHRCDFCTDWDSKYYKRRIDDVIADVRNVAADVFAFCDPNFGANAKFTSALLKEMIPLKKKYVMETSLAFLSNDEYLKLLRDSGCVAIEIGIESLSTPYQKNGVKEVASLMENTIQRIRRIKQYIPGVQANIIFGFDNDTEETFHSVVELHRLANIDSMVPFIATPFPGTPLWDRLELEGRIFERDWQFFNTKNLVITLKNLSAFSFYDLYIDVQRKINSPLVILRKVFKHLRDYKSMRMAFTVLIVLLIRARNAFYFVIPELQRAKKRVISEGTYDKGSSIAPPRLQIIGSTNSK